MAITHTLSVVFLSFLAGGAFFVRLDKRLDDGFFLVLRFTGEADSSESDDSSESGDGASDSSELSKEGGDGRVVKGQSVVNRSHGRMRRIRHGFESHFQTSP